MVCIGAYRSIILWMHSCLGKILTIEKLRKRGKIVVDRCHISKNCGEMVDHPLLHCDLAKELWLLALNLFGMHILMPWTVIDVFAYVGKEIYLS